jgi:hypothetical protein
VIRGLVVVAVAALALVFSGGAFALDHVSIRTHDLVLSKRVVKKPLPLCRKGQTSTRKRPCRKAGSHASAVVSRPGPPDSGWLFGLSVSQNADGTWPLTVTLKRTVASTVEQHVYSFSLAATSVTVSPDLATATLDTGAQLGPFGSIKLAFGRVGALASGTPVTGCTGGVWQTRAGTLAGKVDFVADKTYFQTILKTVLPADVSANTGPTPACALPPVPCTHGQSLSSSAAAGGSTLYASGGQLAQSGSFSLFQFFQQKIGPATVSHILIEGNLPATDLTVAPDLSTATVTTTGASRFTGSLSFTATAPATSSPFAACGGTYTIRQGTTSGGIVAHFLAIPPPALALGRGYAGVR